MAIENDLYLNNVVLLLHFDGADNSTTFIDYSTYGRTVTANGNAKISTTQSKFGGSSAYFDGSGDYLSVPNSTDFNLDTGDFTLEFWFYGGVHLNRVIGNLDATSGWLVTITVGTEAKWNQFPNYAYALGPAPTADSWNHIAVCRKGDIVTVYVNGTGGTPLDTPSRPAATANDLNIGRDISTIGTDETLGYIDDLRITKGKARYTSDFTPPIRAHPDKMFFGDRAETVLLLHCNGSDNSTTFVDSSMYSRTVSVYGDTKQKIDQYKFDSSSAYFDGTGDYLTLASSTDFDFGTDDYTMELWIYPTAIGATRTLLSRYTTWSSSVEFYSYITSAGKIGFQAGNSVPINITGTTTLVANQWYHVAFTRFRGTTRVFLNGGLEASSSVSTSLSSSSPLGIGYELQWNTAYFIGYMDEIRITKGYARYVVPFTPQQAPFEIVPNTFVSDLYGRGTLLSYYDCEDQSGALQDLMLNKPLSLSAGSPSYYQSSILSSNWTDHTLTLANTDSFSGSFHSLSGASTFSIHFYLKTSAVSQTVMQKSGVFSVSLDGSGKLVFGINSNSVTSSQSVNSNTARQITVEFNSGQLIIFIDGQLDTFQTFESTTITDPDTQILILGGFDGTIDEIAFYSNAMKFYDSQVSYLTSFGLPTSPVIIKNDMVYLNPGANPISLQYQVIDGLIKTETDLQDGGVYTISGIITIRGNPVSRKVRLCDLHSGRVVRETLSDPLTGAYTFTKIKNEQFYIWAIDYENNYNPVSSIPVVTLM